MYLIIIVIVSFICKLFYFILSYALVLISRNFKDLVRMKEAKR